MHRGSERILVIDDDPVSLRFVSTLLREKGYDVLTAEDGRYGCELAQKHRPDLIVSDLLMPYRDGFHVVRVLRADASLAATPIILLTMRGGEEDVVRGLDEGADDYVVKPFNARELLARIRKQLERGRKRVVMNERLLLWTVAIVGAVFLGLTLLIVLNKAWRETHTRRHRSRWWALEPGILSWVHGTERSILLAFPGGVSPRDRSVVEDILLAHVQRVRGIARDRFRAALDQLGFVDDYLHELKSARWWFRAQAAERLGLAGSARATDPLVAALNDDSVEVRIRAARALGAVGGTMAIRSLAGALQEPTRWSTLRIADILSEMGPEVVDDLVEQFPRLPVRAKLAVLDILARVRSFHIAPWLRDRLTDEDADIRARACHAIGSLGDPEAGRALRDVLHDPAWPARAMAAKALGRVRHLEAIPDLCEALRDREWWVRANAAQALRDLGPAGLDALVWMLEDADAFARQQAVLMLEQAGVLDQKVNLLAKPDPEEREAALAFVRRFIEAGQVWRLHEHAASHPEPQVRHTIRAAFEALEPKSA